MGADKPAMGTINRSLRRLCRSERQALSPGMALLASFVKVHKNASSRPHFRLEVKVRWLCELDHSANVATRQHIRIGFVHLVERVGSCHQLIQFDLASMVQCQQVGNVVAGLRGAIEWSHQRLLEEYQVQRWYGNGLSSGGREIHHYDNATVIPCRLG